MGFIKKIWKDRISEFPTRRSLTKTDGTSELVTVARSEGMISEEGDAFSAENMNDFENRVANGFNELTENLTWQLAGEVKGKKEILIPASAKEIYVEVGSDTSKLGTVTIPVIRLSEKDIKYNLYELYLNGQQYIRSIVVSKLRVIIGECKTADKDASSSTVTTMYYR
jgi:hypothetical protein